MLDTDIKAQIYMIEQALDECIIDLVPFEQTLKPLLCNTMARLRQQRRELETLLRFCIKCTCTDKNI